jgi:hypothetical protein
MQVGNIFDFGKKSLLKEILATEKKISKLDKKINSNDETLNELKNKELN